MGDDGFKVDSAFVRGASTELIDALLVAREIAQKQQPLQAQLAALQKHYSSPYQAGEIDDPEARSTPIPLGDYERSLRLLNGGRVDQTVVRTK
ncbi:hypothetical protein [Embleya sp. NPDC005575]|uniref:hypothetical protein n=1 Tax=Embleya sp. NPDC005575 TaxID=3156892 RepID=UPI0033BA7B21